MAVEPEGRPPRRGVTILHALLGGAVAAMVFVPPIAQPPGYHRFADAATRFGIPNAWNVLSNLPFALAGLLGMVRVAGARPSWQRTAALWMFGAVALVAAGSSYYHWQPSDGRLVWDRLPIAVAFMALFCLVVADRVSNALGRRLLAPLLLLGAASAITWWYTNDLRVYGIVQYGAMLGIVLLSSLCPSSRPRAGWIWAGLGLYAVAKVCEARPFDEGMAVSFRGWLSGHTLKHLFAAAATLVLVHIWGRRAISSAGGPP